MEKKRKKTAAPLAYDNYYFFSFLILPFLLGGIYPYPTCTCSHVPTLPTLGPALKKKMPDAWMSHSVGFIVLEGIRPQFHAGFGHSQVV